MILQPENSKYCFKRLLQESKSIKFHTSLERTCKACDEIEEMQGLINYSKVAQYTENHFGSPKRQTIMNSKNLRLYIDLRRQEYSQKSPKTKKETQNKTYSQYPCADLDLKTKIYIDQLRARNAFLEKSMNYLQQELLCETRRNPINLSDSISAGVQDNSSMRLVKEDKKIGSTELLETTKTAIQKLLSLAENPNSRLEIQVVNGENTLVLDTPSIIETILFGHELRSLQEMVYKTCQ